MLEYIAFPGTKEDEKFLAFDLMQEILCNVTYHFFNNYPTINVTPKKGIQFKIMCKIFVKIYMFWFHPKSRLRENG